MTAPDEVVDGPWRISRRFRIAVLAGIGDLEAAATAARLGSMLTGAGLPVTEARAAPPGSLGACLHRAAASGVDLLVVAATTEFEPSSVAELRRVADSDPMIAVVQPRFVAKAWSAAPDPDRAVDYGFLPDRRCAYIKASALAAAGGGFGPSDDGRDDLFEPLLALNRVGFRVAVARHATATHSEERSVGAGGDVPAEWRPALARHLAGAPVLADLLMAGLKPGPEGRLAVAFDLAHAGPSHSGTTWLARALVGRAVGRWRDFDLYVVATPAAFDFHFGDLGTAVGRIDPADARVVAALIRIGQPFLWKDIDAAARRAPVLLLFLLDTIGLDCQRDAPDELDALWRFCLAEADAVLFNSAFTRRQFTRRFSLRPDMLAVVSPHSLDLADYRIATVPDAPADGTILLVGNSMPHKRLKETAVLLSGAKLGRPLTALGLAEPIPGVDARPSGTVTPGEMAALYAAARIVVYPSLYEGFGFPLLDALAHRRPILVRDLPPYAEIAAGLPERANIHRYADEADLLRQLAAPPAWTDERAPVTATRRWDDALDDLRHTLEAALAGASRDRVVKRIDVLRGRVSYMRARAFGDAAGADDLDRLAGLSGRMVQTGILWLGRHVPGTPRLLAGLHRGLDRLRGLGYRR